VREHVEKKLESWLRVVDASVLEGRMKAWIVNFYICAKLAWWLMIQDFSSSTTERWQNMIHSHFRKWLGLAECAERTVLYRTNEHFGLNFKNIVEVQRQLRVVKWHIVKHSKDPHTRRVYEYRLALDKKGQTGKGHSTTSPCMEIEGLERSVDFDRIVGRAQHGNSGVGFQKALRTNT
jgi:hypothetical protein